MLKYLPATLLFPLLTTVIAQAVTPSPHLNCLPPQNMKVEIQSFIPRSKPGFTQGLVYLVQNGKPYLLESTGAFNDVSVLNLIDLGTGKVNELSSIPDGQFGEGIALFNDEILLLTWQDNLVHRWKFVGTNIQLVSSVPNEFVKEGWGASNYRGRLLVSDGSQNLTVVDPETLQKVDFIPVKEGGRRTPRQLNALQVVGDFVYANDYANFLAVFEIVKVDLKTGCVVEIVDLKNIDPHFPDDLRDVFVPNGIAYDPQAGDFYLTGKNWQKIFKVRIIKASFAQ